jgi:hypothetical protein
MRDPDEFIEVAIDVEDGRLVMVFSPPTEGLAFSVVPDNTVGPFMAALRAVRPKLDRSAPPLEGSDGIVVRTRRWPSDALKAEIGFPRVMERIVLNVAQLDQLLAELEAHVPLPGDFYTSGPDCFTIHRPAQIVSEKVLRLPPLLDELVDVHRRVRPRARNQDEEVELVRQELGPAVYDAIPYEERSQALRAAAKGQPSRRGRRRKTRLPRRLTRIK